MTCEKCSDTGFVTVEINGYSAVKACSCRPSPSAKQSTPLSVQEASAAMDLIFSLLDFTPNSPEARAILTAGFRSMCQTREQAEYVVHMVSRYHTKWSTCGLPGLRQILCVKYTPPDGVVITRTAAYPEGLPEHRGPEEKPWTPPRLPPGRSDTADRELDAAVQQAAVVRSMGSVPAVALSAPDRRREAEFTKILEETLTPPEDRPKARLPRAQKLSAVVKLHDDPEPEPRPAGTYKRITQADIDAAVAGLHAQEANRKDDDE